MLFFTFTIPITLLFKLASAEPSVPSSPSQHVRRNQPPHTYWTYIMRDSYEPVDEHLVVYDKNGWIKAEFQKNTYDLRRGKSNVVVTDSSRVNLRTLKSEDDLCGVKSHYANERVEISINPRGLRSDQWKIKKLVSGTPSSGVYETYLFKRHATNKNGRIYDANGNLVAELINEVRYEKWLNPGKEGVKTYTLRQFQPDPNVDLVTLMGLVMSRTDVCGL